MSSYTEEAWQAQLEEAIALQSIYGDAFRVTHIPCEPAAGAHHASHQQQQQQQCHLEADVDLESLLGSSPPPPPGDGDAAAGAAGAAGGMLACEVLVAVELPAGQLQLLLDTGTAAGGGPDSSQQHQPGSNSLLAFGPPVKHLPPVCVCLQFPRSYPDDASAPPLLQARASWLSEQHEHALQQQLAALWEEQGPAPVAFSLLEHIRTGMLPALGIQEQLVLSAPLMQQQQQHQQRGGQAGRSSVAGGALSPAAAPFTPSPSCRDAAAAGSSSSSSSSTSAVQQQQHMQAQQQQAAQDGAAGAAPAAAVQSLEQLALQLLRFNAAQEQAEFDAASWTCGICFESVAGADCTRLDCRHFYCTACMRAAAAAQLQDGAVDAMRCPEPSCRAPLPPHQLQALLGREQWERWDALSLSRALDRMHDVILCPRCDTPSVEDADHLAICPSPACEYAFCTFCSDSWHPGTQCLDPVERLRVLERRRRATTAADRQRELDLVQQAMSLQYMSGISKACPGCGMATIKSEGCNKMQCSSCAAKWCWKCLKVIDGYDHFKADAGLCVLFDQAEIDRWHQMLFGNARAVEVEAGHRAVLMQRRHGGGGGGPTHQNQRASIVRCVVCGQDNLREGRLNLLRCWSCSSHSCVACRTWLRGGKPGQHYIGAGACKQHGDV